MSDLPNAPEKRPMIHCVGISKTYGGDETHPRQEVLRGVGLEVARGEFFSLMGASGSGKTTLLNLIGGLDIPDSGRIEVAQTDLHRLNDRARSEFRLRHIGFVFQTFNLLPHLSVRENIALPLLFLNRTEDEANAAAGALAGEVGLADKLNRPINKLSGGEMQRVALARALVHQPQLLLADEPTGNLDSKTGEVVLELIRSLAQKHHATVLMVTHDHEAAAHADRIIHMRDGWIVEA